MNEAMNEAVYQALCACFALAPSSAEASGLIREAYQEPENSPMPPREQNVIYYHLESSPEARVAPPVRNTKSPYPEYYWFPEVKLHVTCYGRDAEEMAEQIRIYIYLTGAGMPRTILKKAGIYVMPNTREPIHSCEEVGSRWRHRSDVTILLRKDKKLTHPARQNMISEPPDIHLIISHLGLFEGQPTFSPVSS